MSNSSEQMRNAILCVDPLETYDGQVQRVMNCSASGSTVVETSIEPQTVPTPQVVQPGPRGTIDADNITPGEPAAPVSQPEAKDPPPQPGSANTVVTWVKENPLLAGGAAVALFLLLHNKRRG